MSHTNTRARIAAPRRKGNTAVNGRAERLFCYIIAHTGQLLYYRSARLSSIAQRVYLIRQCSVNVSPSSQYLYIYIYHILFCLDHHAEYATLSVVSNLFYLYDIKSQFCFVHYIIDIIQARI
jgi:hypothetical protein